MLRCAMPKPMPRGMRSNANAWTISWVMRPCIRSGGSSIGITMRFFTGSVNASTPSGMNAG